MTDAAAQSPSSGPTRRRVPRAVRVLLRVLLVGLVLASAGLLVVTRSWFLVDRVAPVLEQRLGGDITISRATYDLAGRLVLHDVALQSPGHDGPAGEVVRVGRIIVNVHPGRVLLGRVDVVGVELNDFRLRLAENRQRQGIFTFMDLRPHAPTEDSDVRLPPHVTITSGAIELGLFDDEGYERVGQREVRGHLSPFAFADQVLLFSLQERVATASADNPAVQITGSWNLSTHAVEARLRGLELDDRAHAMCPAWARLWWDQLQLAGRVGSASLSWDATSGIALRFDVENVELTLPIEAGELWARYSDGRVEPARGRPRMRVTSGSIELNENGVAFNELQGQIRGAGDDMTAVPYQVTLRMPQLPELDWEDRQRWGARVLERAPFEMTVLLNEFRPARDATGAIGPVELPLAVARFFERFTITDWQLSTQIRIRRVAGDPPTIESDGQIYIQHAAGAFEKFPYPLEDVEAYLHFDRDAVDIEYIAGRGAGGATVRIAGDIAPPGRDAAIALRLTATDVPLDERFRSALQAGPAAVYDTLLNEPAAAALADAGLLLDDDAIATARAERDALVAGASTPPDAASRRRIGQLDRIIDAGPFRLGGTVDLDLLVQRSPGPGRRTVITGSVDVARAGVVFEGFPYPVIVTGGRLNLHEDRVELESGLDRPGLVVVTPGGGEGIVTGQIGIRRRAGDAAPPSHLDLTVVDDHINPALIASMPGASDASDDGATPRALVEAAGVRGDVHYGGTIRIDAERRTRFDIDVDLFDGEAHPQRRLAALLGLADDSGDGAAAGGWPAAWRYDDVTARLALSERGIRIEALDAQQAGAGTRLHASGRVDIEGDERSTQVAVTLAGAALDPDLTRMLPRGLRDTAEALWRRYEPRGRFSAWLEYRDGDPDEDPLKLELLPLDVSLRVGDRRVALTGEAGRIVFASDGYSIDGLALREASAGGEGGRIVLEGGGAWDALQLEGTWRDGRVGSPLGRALVDRLATGRPADVDLVDGAFDAQFEYRRGDAAPPDYVIDVAPRTLTLQRGNDRAALAFDGGSSLRVTPGGMTIDVAGRRDDDTFEVRGDVHVVGHLDARLQVRYGGPLAGPLPALVLPPGARAAIADRGLAETGRADVAGRVRASTLPAAAPGGPSPWRTAFDGTVVADGLTLRAGADFEQISGRFAVRADREPGRPLHLEITTDDARAVHRGQPLTDIAARLRLSPDGRSIAVEDLQATLHGGTVSGDALVELDGVGAYELSLNLVDVPMDPLLEAGAAPGDGGDVYAGLRLSGRIGEPTSRRGRGTLRIIDGTVAGIPLLLQITQVLQLTLPLKSGLDYADVEFYVSGDRLTFERILFESTVGDSAQLQLIGGGELDLATMELDTRFRSRSGWLLVRDLIGGIGDRLWVIRVTGPLRDPRASLVPLPALAGPQAATDGS